MTAKEMFEELNFICTHSDEYEIYYEKRETLEYEKHLIKIEFYSLKGYEELGYNITTMKAIGNSIHPLDLFINEKLNNAINQQLKELKESDK